MAGWRAVLVCIAAAFFAFFYDSTVAENVFYGVLGSLVVAVFIDLGNTRSDRIEKERLREQANLDFKEKCGSIPFMLWDLTGHPVGEKAYVDKMIIELFRYDSEPYSSGFFHVAAGVSCAAVVSAGCVFPQAQRSRATASVRNTNRFFFMVFISYASFLRIRSLYCTTVFLRGKQKLFSPVFCVYLFIFSRLFCPVLFLLSSLSFAVGVLLSLSS